MALVLLFLTLLGAVGASPRIGLPVNAQVPPVARSAQPYRFTFSDSTFLSDGAITYSLVQSPSWIELDSASRTISGKPGPDDSGAVNLQLIASDSTGSVSMPITLVVSSDPGPGLGIPIADQLSDHAGFQSPDTILILPSTSLSLSFSHDTFKNTSQKTVYYAQCTNNTPLPSWIRFDPDALSFTGTSPQFTSPDELPQSYRIQFTASDIAGFSAAVAYFDIVVERHVFGFGSREHTIHAMQGEFFNYTGLQSALTLDGIRAIPSDITKTHTDAPEWLLVDPSTLVLSGKPPRTASSPLRFSVTATDRFGENATAYVSVLLSDTVEEMLFSGPLPSAEAVINTRFEYFLGQSVNTGINPQISVDLGGASSWLKFDPDALTLKGSVPADLRPQQVNLNVMASKGPAVQVEVLSINVEKSAHNSNGRTTQNPTDGSIGTNTSRPTDQPQPTIVLSNHEARKYRSRTAATIAIPTVFVLVLLLLAAFFLTRRKKRKQSENLLFMAKKKISHPFFSETNGDAEAKAENPEMTMAAQKRASSRAPIIDLPGPWASGANKRLSLFRSSKASTNDPKFTQKTDSWHAYMKDLESVKPKATAEAELTLAPEEQTSARSSRRYFASKYHLSTKSKQFGIIESSPSNKQSGRRKRKSDLSFATSAFIASQRMSGIGHGQNSSGFSTSCFGMAHAGVGHGNGGPPGFGIVRKSWHNPSARSWPSTDSSWPTTDSTTNTINGSYSRINGKEQPPNLASTMISFPRPPTSSTIEQTNEPHLIRRMEDDGHHRTSIRRVNSPPLTYSLPLQAFHKRRARNQHKRNTFFSAGHSPRASSHLNWAQSIRSPLLSTTQSVGSIQSSRRKSRASNIRYDNVKDVERSYSQSSSLEPPSRPSPPKRSPRRRSGNANNNNSNNGGLGSRISDAFSRRFHSKSSLGSSQQFESAESEGLEEERDDEGNRLWRHVDLPNPLATHGTSSSVLGDEGEDLSRGSGRGDGGDVEALLRGAGMGRRTQRLSFLRAQGDQRGGNAVGGERTLVMGSRGKRPVSVDNGMISREPSMRGHIIDDGNNNDREGAFL